jgi:hypothetical protein
MTPPRAPSLASASGSSRAARLSKPLDHDDIEPISPRSPRLGFQNLDARAFWPVSGKAAIRHGLQLFPFFAREISVVLETCSAL